MDSKFDFSTEKSVHISTKSLDSLYLEGTLVYDLLFETPHITQFTSCYIRTQVRNKIGISFTSKIIFANLSSSEVTLFKIKLVATGKTIITWSEESNYFTKGYFVECWSTKEILEIQNVIFLRRI